MWCTGAATGLLAGGGAAGGGVAGAAGCGSSGGSSAAGGGPSGAAGGIQLQLVAGAPRESQRGSGGGSPQSTAGVWGRQPPGLKPGVYNTIQ